MFFTLTTASAQNQMPAEKLLAAFGENCSVNGGLAATTSQQTKVLVDLLQEAKDNPDCGTLPYASANANLLFNNASAYERLQVTTAENQYLFALEQERNLLSALTVAKAQTPLNQENITTIESELRFVQDTVARASQFNSLSRINQIVDSRNRTYNSMLGTTRALFGPSVQNDLCWSKKKSFFEGLTVSATSILASSFSSTYTLPISAGAELASQLMEIIRKAKINGSIARASDAVAQKAYQCAVEKMSELWCVARDKKVALEMLAKSVVHQPKDQPVTQGLTLLNQDLPVVLNWLEKVSLGSEPVNLGQARRQSLAFSRETMVTRAAKEGSGLIHEYQSIFNLAATPDEKWSVIRKVITELGQILAVVSTPQRHPIFESVPENVFPYYLLGRNKDNFPRNLDGTLKDWANFNALAYSDWSSNGQTPIEAYVPSLEKVEDQFLLAVQRATELTTREKQDVLHADSLFLLSEAMDPDLRRMSPYDSLTQIANYIRTHTPPQFRDVVNQKLYQQTSDTLAQLLNAVQTSTNRDATKTPAEALREVYAAAHLETGISYFETLVRRSLRLALNELAFSDDPNMNAFLLGNDDVTDSFLLLKPGASIDDTRDDANSAQSSTFTNLNEFGDVFEGGIKTVLENYLKKELIEGDDSPSREMRASLCYKLYSLPQWPKNIKPEYCLGTQLKSSVPNGPVTVPWAQATLAQPLKNRVCLYYDYKRLRKIYQDHCRREGKCQ